MFRASLGGKPCYASVVEARNLARNGKPIPPDFDKANSFRLSCGREPGQGWLLMRRGDLDGLGLNALQTLIFEFENEDRTRNTLTWQNLVIGREPLGLTTSYTANDADAIFLVHVADARWRVHNPYFQLAINKQYNVRAGTYGGSGGATEYLSSSLNAGAAWTWQTMVSDIWGLMTTQLGAAPTLPVTPDGTPEGFMFLGMSAWDALTIVLTRIGCIIKPDLSVATNQFSIVQIGAADAASDLTLAVADSAYRKIHDAEFQNVIRGRVPYGVRVFFHRKEQYGGTEETTPRTSTNWLSGTPYSVDVVGPDLADAETGIYHPIFDDLPAIYDPTATLTNAAALTTRATERANDFYRMLRTDGGGRLWKRYSGLLSLNPGSKVKTVAWQEDQNGKGVFTEVVRHPFLSEWEMATAWDSTRLHPPDFRPTFPNYPEVSQVLEIANGTISSGFFDSTIEKSDGVGGFSDKESIWGLDLAGATSLVAGARYLARLEGYVTGRPLYVFRSVEGEGTADCPGYFGDLGGLCNFFGSLPAHCDCPITGGIQIGPPIIVQPPMKLPPYTKPPPPPITTPIKITKPVRNPWKKPIFPWFPWKPTLKFPPWWTWIPTFKIPILDRFIDDPGSFTGIIYRPIAPPDRFIDNPDPNIPNFIGMPEPLFPDRPIGAPPAFDIPIMRPPQDSPMGSMALGGTLRPEMIDLTTQVNGVLPAANGGGSGSTIVKKTANEGKTADTTMANDALLTFSMAANTTYHIRIHAAWDAGAGSFKYALTGPASPTSVRVWRRVLVPGGTTEVVGNDTSYTSSTSVVGVANGGHVIIEAIVQNGANSGTFALQWAQNSASGTTTVLAGSQLEYLSFS